MNYETATPREIDTLLARTHYEQEGAYRSLVFALRSATNGDRDADPRFLHISTYVSGGYRQKSYTAEAWLDLNECEVTRNDWNTITHVDGVFVQRSMRTDTRQVLDLIGAKGTQMVRTVAEQVDNERVASALAEVDRLHSITVACNDQFSRRGGWSRFWLVTSSQGHIHSSGSCSTCHKGRKPTTFALVCDLSDSTEVEAVDLFGAALCSVCFPDAPVEFTDQVKITKARALAYAEGGIDAYRALVAKSTKSTNNA